MNWWGLLANEICGNLSERNFILIGKSSKMFENDTVSSPEEAYLLGFLYADGCITSKRINS